MQLKSPIKDLINEVIKQKKEGVIFNCRDYKSQMKDLIDEVIKHQQEGVILNCRDYWNLSSCLTLTKKNDPTNSSIPLIVSSSCDDDDACLEYFTVDFSYYIENISSKIENIFQYSNENYIDVIDTTAAEFCLINLDRNLDLTGMTIVAPNVFIQTNGYNFKADAIVARTLTVTGTPSMGGSLIEINRLDIDIAMVILDHSAIKCQDLHVNDIFMLNSILVVFNDYKVNLSAWDKSLVLHPSLIAQPRKKPDNMEMLQDSFALPSKMKSTYINHIVASKFVDSIFDRSSSTNLDYSGTVASNFVDFVDSIFDHSSSTNLDYSSSGTSNISSATRANNGAYHDDVQKFLGLLIKNVQYGGNINLAKSALIMLKKNHKEVESIIDTYVESSDIDDFNELTMQDLNCIIFLLNYCDNFSDRIANIKCLN